MKAFGYQNSSLFCASIRFYRDVGRSSDRSDIGQDMERISLVSLFPVALTGQQPLGQTGQARTVTPCPANQTQKCL
jgi:hypothetical protein